MIFPTSTESINGILWDYHRHIHLLHSCMWNFVEVIAGDDPDQHIDKLAGQATHLGSWRELGDIAVYFAAGHAELCRMGGKPRLAEFAHVKASSLHAAVHGVCVDCIFYVGDLPRPAGDPPTIDESLKNFEIERRDWRWLIEPNIAALKSEFAELAKVLKDDDSTTAMLELEMSQSLLAFDQIFPHYGGADAGSNGNGDDQRNDVSSDLARVTRRRRRAKGLEKPPCPKCKQTMNVDGTDRASDPTRKTITRSFRCDTAGCSGPDEPVKRTYPTGGTRDDE